MKILTILQGLIDKNPLTEADLEELRLFWFLCENEVYTDRISVKIVLKVLPDKHSTIP
ncbi:hypothetical protein RKE53_22975 [Microcystis aeruginosa NRERC-214]|nr:hypothetical protein [Microcystis aeruginosa]WNF14823.1 hypothetical protein RKE53_22975 [Microcystis aeruginosa NRERC-214]